MIEQLKQDAMDYCDLFIFNDIDGFFIYNKTPPIFSKLLAPIRAHRPRHFIKTRRQRVLKSSLGKCWPTNRNNRTHTAGKSHVKCDCEGGFPDAALAK